MAARVNVRLAPSVDCDVQGVYSPLPSRVKDRLVLLVLDRTHAVHAAHVMNAIHCLPPCGKVTLATPIMASRVTSAASASSVRFSLPAGRSGKTR